MYSSSDLISGFHDFFPELSRLLISHQSLAFLFLLDSSGLEGGSEVSLIRYHELSFTLTN